ncbi:MULTISPECIES: hypothetical protein [unclassified Pantoea]|uniref:hypothetical protein n=1 Tax=unclassified Pantoea TaxID=2630326 RepID=UPI001231EBFB|nr:MULTISPECIES: hypothetical protein [unclassified Pantoea]KAA6097097.1 hypothetical protein F3I21_17675 [Pantoea sp. B_9]KAA6110455.1 hypothetical protein F3I18_17885 [Pantoea sp. B_10]
MLNNNSTNSPNTSLVSVPGVDTSHLYLSLVDRFKKNHGKPISVDFRKLLPWVKLGDQFTHLIHPYPAKLIPHIANFFTNASILVKRNEVVLDPFSGSGTVALEASLADRIPHVADANPLATLISKVKGFNYDVDELAKELIGISSRAKRYRTAPTIEVVNSSFWYADLVKLKLEIVLRAIMQVENDDVRDFFRVCFSATAKKFSNADPAISVPVRLKCKDSFSVKRNNEVLERLNWLKTASVIDEFNSLCLMNIQRVKSANEYNPQRKNVHVISDNVNNLESNYRGFEKPSLIITSPPYGSAQKYIRSSSLSLNWLGFSEPKDLTKLENLSIGREHAPQYRKREYFEELPSFINDFLVHVNKSNQTRFEITKQYLCEMKIALREMSKTVKEDGHIVIVTGNNSVCGKVLENDLFITTVMAELGLKLQLHLYDAIKSRGLMTKRNKTASIINKEHVLVFHKEAGDGAH